MPSRLLVCAFAVLLTAGCASGADGKAHGRTVVAGQPLRCVFEDDPTGTVAGSVAKPADLDVPTTGTATITFTTNKGAVRIETDSASGPCAAYNLRYLVERKYYDGSSCHRLTTNKAMGVLQCGDPTGTGSGTPGYQFDDKLPDKSEYRRGMVAMANAGPGTNGSQFFIVHSDTADIPPDYPVIGKVTAGMEIVDQIAAGGVRGGPTDGSPVIPLTLTSAAAG
jgi:peptidyl-prolyl cis-trans isomerase B (cyclophilin B)